MNVAVISRMLPVLIVYITVLSSMAAAVLKLLPVPRRVRRLRSQVSVDVQ